MKLSTKFLKKLIKEEIENFLSEEAELEAEEDQEGESEGGFKFKLDPQAAQAAVNDGFKADKK